MYTPLIGCNPNIDCTPGWCLEYVRRTFGQPGIYPSATAAWEASTTQHKDLDIPSGVYVPVWFSLENEPNGHVALVDPWGSVYSTSDLGNVPHKHPSLDNLMSYYSYYGMPLTYLGWTEDIQGTPVISPEGLAAQGTITETDDDMFTDDDRAKLVAALDKANRASEVAQATEDRGDSAKIALALQILEKLAPQFSFFKGPTGDTLYVLESGHLRGITNDEWQAKGGFAPEPITQDRIDKLTQGPAA